MRDAHDVMCARIDAIAGAFILRFKTVDYTPVGHVTAQFEFSLLHLSKSNQSEESSRLEAVFNHRHAPRLVYGTWSRRGERGESGAVV